jgi:hypothetical protein
VVVTAVLLIVVLSLLIGLALMLRSERDAQPEGLRAHLIRRSAPEIEPTTHGRVMRPPRPPSRTRPRLRGNDVTGRVDCLVDIGDGDVPTRWRRLKPMKDRPFNHLFV